MTRELLQYLTSSNSLEWLLQMLLNFCSVFVLSMFDNLYTIYITDVYYTESYFIESIIRLILYYDTACRGNNWCCFTELCITRIWSVCSVRCVMKADCCDIYIPIQVLNTVCACWHIPRYPLRACIRHAVMGVCILCIRRLWGCPG